MVGHCIDLNIYTYNIKKKDLSEYTSLKYGIRGKAASGFEWAQRTMRNETGYTCLFCTHSSRPGGSEREPPRTDQELDSYGKLGLESQLFVLVGKNIVKLCNVCAKKCKLTTIRICVIHKEVNKNLCFVNAFLSFLSWKRRFCNNTNICDDVLGSDIEVTFDAWT